jgi:hypothetical protein
LAQEGFFILELSNDSLQLNGCQLMVYSPLFKHF